MVPDEKPAPPRCRVAGRVSPAEDDIAAAPVHVDIGPYEDDVHISLIIRLAICIGNVHQNACGILNAAAIPALHLNIIFVAQREPQSPRIHCTGIGRAATEELDVTILHAREIDGIAQREVFNVITTILDRTRLVCQRATISRSINEDVPIFAAVKLVPSAIASQRVDVG